MAHLILAGQAGQSGTTHFCPPGAGLCGRASSGTDGTTPYRGVPVVPTPDPSANIPDPIENYRELVLAYGSDLQRLRRDQSAGLIPSWTDTLRANAKTPLQVSTLLGKPLAVVKAVAAQQGYRDDWDVLYIQVDRADQLLNSAARDEAGAVSASQQRRIDKRNRLHAWQSAAT